MTSASGALRSSKSFSFTRVLLVFVPLSLVCVASIWLTNSRIERNARQQSEEAVLSRLGLITATPSLLDPRFDDTDGDLVADAPNDERQQLAPEILVFSYVAGPDSAEEIAAWQEFVEHLSRKARKHVDTVAFSTTSEQLMALTNGKLHVTGLNTGAVTTAVTMSGFVPVCTFGRQDGTFGSSMRFIVPAGSSVRSLDDLKSRTVAFTVADSNSGCKAAMVLLRDHNLLPQRDYMWRFSGGHQESIRGVAQGRYDAAPVSDDLWQRAVSNHDVEEAKVRTIYESERFPPATLGYIQSLSPELGRQIREAFLEFDWSGTSLEKQFGVSGASKFVPVSYKQDFALVRRIDDSFRKTPTVPVADEKVDDKGAGTDSTR